MTLGGVIRCVRVVIILTRHTECEEETLKEGEKRLTALLDDLL